MREIIASPIFLYLLINTIGSFFEYISMDKKEKELFAESFKDAFNSFKQYENTYWLTTEIFFFGVCSINFIAWLPIKLVTLFLK